MEKSFGFEDALFMVVGNMVGTGIFAASPLLLQYTPSTGDALILWLLAAFISFSGSMCFAELALLVPDMGSEGIYIKSGFSFVDPRLGKTLGYLFSWTAVTLMKTASVAVMCDICSVYLLSIFAGDPSTYAEKLVSLSLVSTLSLVAVYSTHLSKNVNNAMFFIKSSLVAWIVLAGLLANVFNRELCKGEISFRRSAGATYAQMLTIGLFDAGFAFDGWNNLNYMIPELKNTKDHIRALKVGVPGVGLVYFLLNMSYFIVLDRQSILSTNTVADVFGYRLLGGLGIVVPCLIVFSALGALNGAILSNSRLIYSCAVQGDIPSIFGSLGAHRTPKYGLLLNWVLICIYVLLGDIGSLLSLFSPFYYGFLCLSAVSIVILRSKRPAVEYNVPWYILTSFVLSSLFLWIMPMFIEPLKWITGLSIILFGLLVRKFIPEHYYEEVNDD
eukprot:NODE_194_length_15414_cov_0.324127.p1 type:complete len:444 gc:universal NODE_194_length_15414_cov_0.324127:9054-10385(+)